MGQSVRRSFDAVPFSTCTLRPAAFRGGKFLFTLIKNPTDVSCKDQHERSGDNAHELKYLGQPMKSFSKSFGYQCSREFNVHV